MSMPTSFRDHQGGDHNNNNDHDDVILGYDVPLEFSQDDDDDGNGAARIVNHQKGTTEPSLDFLAIRRRRRRNGIRLSGIILLMVIIVVSVTTVKNNKNDPVPYGDYQWHLVGDHVLEQGTDGVTANPMIELREYVQYGSKVVLDMNGDRLAVAKQGAPGFYGAVDMYSHWNERRRQRQRSLSQLRSLQDGENLNVWYHLKEHAVDHSDNTNQPPSHYHQSVDMSRDGHRIAFNQGNRIYVYFQTGLNGGAGLKQKVFDPLGPVIQMPPGRYDPETTVFGRDLAMSGDGTFVAVMGYSVNAVAPSFVAIYKYSFTQHQGNFQDQWTLVQEITLQSYAGGTLALDTLGTRLAIGEIGGDNGIQRITVYDRNPTDDHEWIERPVVVDHHGLDMFASSYGGVVSLSADGSRLAFGSYRGKGNVAGVLQATTIVPNDDGGNNNSFENTVVQWNLLGSLHRAPREEYHFGSSVAISEDGKRLVVGAPGNPDWKNPKQNQNLQQQQHPQEEEEFAYGRVHLYEFRPKMGEWIEVLEPITSLVAGDAMGSSVAISEQGDYVAIGAPLRNTNPAEGSGAVLTYYIKGNNASGGAAFQANN